MSAPATPSLFDCNHVACVHHRKVYKIKGCGLVNAVERAEKRLAAARADLEADQARRAGADQ